MNSTSPPPYNPDYIVYDIVPTAPNAILAIPQRNNNMFCIIYGEVMSGKTSYIKHQLMKNNYELVEVCYINGYTSPEYSNFTSIITDQLIMSDCFNKDSKCCLILEDCDIRENCFNSFIIILTSF